MTDELPRKSADFVSTFARQLDEAAEGECAWGLGERQPGTRQFSAAIDLSPVRDATNHHVTLGIVDGVDDPIVPNPDAVIVPAGKLGHTHGTRVDGEPVDRGADSIPKPTLQPAVLAGCRRAKADFVLGLSRAYYSRTSAHGTAVSRSSRACRAAKLSSRYSRRSRRSA